MVQNGDLLLLSAEMSFSDLIWAKSAVSSTKTSWFDEIWQSKHAEFHTTSNNSQISSSIRAINQEISFRARTLL